MVPKFRYRPIFEVEQGGTAAAAFDAVDGIIDSITKLQFFSDCKSSPCREIAKDQ
jgi:hypothetical protein